MNVALQFSAIAGSSSDSTLPAHTATEDLFNVLHMQLYSLNVWKRVEYPVKHILLCLRSFSGAEILISKAATNNYLN